MARRMWKGRFSLYVQLVSAPTLLLAVLLMVHPVLLLGLAFEGADVYNPEQATAIHLFARIAGLAVFVLMIQVLGARQHPGNNRGLFFWVALLFLAFSGLIAVEAFLGQANYWMAAPLLIWVPGAAFFLAFASRNVLVRE
ncbi:MAG: hypothetical protein H7A21_04635 [Spirochaetales bacterium]|nr:hypothetical protein [Leptospiraceae bacterium]MCP5480699.1 hypothetical protein [Spirochaetales bacterium]MCP5484051.1 hypothetical protein [Spirochaetales bacterium]